MHCSRTITLVERERDFYVDGLTRERDAAQATYETLAEKYESARLAKVEEEPDVKIGALAVAPQRPIRPRTMLNTSGALTRIMHKLQHFSHFLWKPEDHL